jgi:hypothetical protein
MILMNTHRIIGSIEAIRGFSLALLHMYNNGTLTKMDERELAKLMIFLADEVRTMSEAVMREANFLWATTWNENAKALSKDIELNAWYSLKYAKEIITYSDSIIFYS